MKYLFIRDHVAEYPVRMMCRVLSVSHSGYYAWRRRQPSRRHWEDQRLLSKIREIHLGSRRTYGSPRILADLRKAGVCCSRKRVARLMQVNGIVGRRKPRYIVTTESGGGYEVAPNILARQFTPGGLMAWVADLTYVRTGEGTLYLAVVLNMYSRRVIGWSMGNTSAGMLTVDALKMAVTVKQPVPGQIHHSDRGGHYLSSTYRSLLAEYGMVQSMSRKGDCWDNAVVESFFATLKLELLYPQRIPTRQQARRMIFEYVEVFYNRQRAHSALGYLSPVEYEKLFNAP